MELTRRELLEIGVDALAGDRTDLLPPGMSGRVLGAALARPRPTIHPAWDTGRVEMSAHSAYMTTAAELAEMLGSLVPDDWAEQTDVGDGASVRDVVMHLVGVERYVLGQLGRRAPIDAPRAEDHFPVLRQATADLDRADGAQVARAWWLEAMEVIASCAEVGPDQEVAYHHLAGSLRGMLVIRTFELWTHDDDIRRAVGLPANELDDRRLSLMSTALIEALPLGMALSGTTQPGRAVRVDVTGAGGPTSFVVALSPGETPGLPDLTIQGSALDLCRLASNRLPVDQIDLVAEGDRSLLGPVLVGATAFAMD
jgi:uncharacterized protein (TIGR03083 family)